MIKDEAMGMRFVGKAMILTALSCALTTAFVGCDNALAAGAAALQAKAVSPVISVKLADSSALNSGGSLSFGSISVGSSSDIALTIKNTGVQALSIDLAGIKVTPDSSTAAGEFTVSAYPAASTESGGSTSITIRFSPDAESAMSATIAIPSNDLNTPSFSFSVTGTGLGVVLSTAAVSSIAYVSAKSGGSITSNGGKTITARGVCWGTSPNPTIADGISIDAGTGLGSFTCNLSGLLPGTFYYVRAYATTSAGLTVYGLSQSFTTTAATLPTTATVTAINATSATVGCTAAADTGLTLGDCGVCWGTSSGPTTADSHLSLGTAAGTYTGSVTSLSLATTYYIRAYAILSNGSATITVYGAEKGFKTVGYHGPSSGYVFYDRGEVVDGWRYLEAAPGDLGQYAWGPEVSVSTGTGIGTGSQNTSNAYVAGEYAAAKCLAATYGGNSDFFLPSKDELLLMFTNLALTSLVDFKSHTYWSSSASSNTAAYYRINPVTEGTQVKSNASLYVWAIRQYQ